ncbi:hypothetical protein ABID47_002955 [Paenibacillus favisporus]|uniref:Cyclic lactone autoinducer peptide n=1 Tax=Paenibacillus favisporus TaxID=221028 RepID=A0ABV2F3M0_9BACL
MRTSMSALFLYRMLLNRLRLTCVRKADILVKDKPEIENVDSM